MPTYTYRAITKNGLIVRNRVEAQTKQSLVKMLKSNELLPISVNKVPYSTIRKRNKQKKNIANRDEIMKTINTTSVDTRNKVSSKEKIRMYLSRANQKVTPRDIVVFTQNFYLLKKANFNNIHALRTIIESTENYIFKDILEDILAGLEARRIYVYNNGILFRCFSIHIY